MKILTVATLAIMGPYKIQLTQSLDLVGLSTQKPVITGTTIIVLLKWAFFGAEARTLASKPI